MSSNYFDIDDILCEEQPLKVKFLINIPWNKRLFSHQVISQIEQNSVKDIPYWMSSHLFLNKKVNISLPKFYGQKIREQLQMGANFMSLYDLCPYFFAFSQKLMHILVDDKLYLIIIKAYSERFPEIIKYSKNSLDLDTTKYFSKLDVSERQLFKMAYYS